MKLKLEAIGAIDLNGTSWEDESLELGEQQRRCMKETVEAGNSLQRFLGGGQYFQVSATALAFLLNFTVCCILVRARRKNRNATNWRRSLFLLHLSATDVVCGVMLVTISAITIHVKDPDDNTMMAVAHLLTNIAIVAPTVHYTGLTIMQYIAVRHPLAYQIHLTEHKCRIMLATQWSIILFFPVVAITRAYFVATKDRDHIVAIALAVLILEAVTLLSCTLSLTASYICFIVNLVKRMRYDPSKSQRAYLSKANVSTIINTAVLLLTLWVIFVLRTLKLPHYCKLLTAKKSDYLSLNSAIEADSEIFGCPMLAKMKNLLRLKMAAFFADNCMIVRMISDPIIYMTFERRKKSRARHNSRVSANTLGETTTGLNEPGRNRHFPSRSHAESIELLAAGTSSLRQYT